MAAQACSACGASERETRSLPRVGGDGDVALQPVCELCVMGAIGELRALVARVAASPDDDGAEMSMLLLIALLKRHGREITSEHTGGIEGMAGVRHGLLAILDTLERRLMCSACGAVIPESRTVVMPWFNDSARAYVETFRCQACAPSSLAETVARVRDVDTRTELDGLGAFMRDHGVFMHEWLRGDPDDVVRRTFLTALEMLGAGKLVVRVGTTQPIPR